VNDAVSALAAPVADSDTAIQASMATSHSVRRFVEIIRPSVAGEPSGAASEMLAGGSSRKASSVPQCRRGGSAQRRLAVMFSRT
jgi:hypothetical protein